MARIFVGLGSNLGDGPGNLLGAWERLGREAGIELVKISSPYRSEPVGMESSHWFTNAVAELRSVRSPHDLLSLLLAVEHEFGRRRKANSVGYQDRSLDLDLLYYGEMVIESRDLVLPHPRITERLFVLLPLAEIAPEFHDPVSGLSCREMAARLESRLGEAREDGQQIARGSWPQKMGEES